MCLDYWTELNSGIKSIIKISWPNVKMLYCHFAKQFCAVLSKAVTFLLISSLNLVIFLLIMFANLWHCIQKLPSESCLLIIFITLLQPCVSHYDTRGIKMIILILKFLMVIIIYVS